MSESEVDTIKKLAYRLDDATSDERVNALHDLSSLARNSSRLVGSIALPKVLGILRGYDNVDEYQEALELIERLLSTTKDPDAANANAQLIVNDSRNVELFLDLLSHPDLTIGVQTSQILTALHNLLGKILEDKIQACPEGMTKLLQQLPNSSREQVRDQAIVLVQLLTESNEEMKKTLIFNEGFDSIFNIIEMEGGARSPGYVIKDCLVIIANVLNKSETCQRLFIGMGAEWIFRLGEFIDPAMLEAYTDSQSLYEDDNNGDGDSSRTSNTAWFQDTSSPFLSCAILAMKSLASSINIPNLKHQLFFLDRCQPILLFAAHWIARKGPKELVHYCLEFFHNLLQKPANITDDPKLQSLSADFCNLVLQIPAPIPGKSLPKGLEPIPSLSFGWKPVARNEKKFIGVPSLLAERYIFNSPPFWAGENVDNNIMKSYAANEDFSVSCFNLLDSWLSCDGKGYQSDFIIQFILAPPPPSHAEMDDIDSFDSRVSPKSVNLSNLDTMRPLGFLVAHTLVEYLQRLLPSNGSFSLGPTFKNDVEIIERCTNILTSVYINGGPLTRELSTVLNTSHVSLSPESSQIPMQPLLPFLLANAGKAMRINNGMGHTVFVALMRMLSSAACNCDKAVKQLLTDFSNLFFIDLATSTSENTGVPAIIQISSCLFIGICFNALQEQESRAESNSNPQTSGDSETLTAKSFLKIIDSKIGLQRFNDTLRKPLSTSKSSFSSEDFSSLFFTPNFKIFYENQVDSIRKAIFQFYTATSGSGLTNSNFDASSVESMKEIVTMQRDRIAELENILAGNGQLTISDGNGNSDELEAKIVELEEIIKNMKENESLQQSQLNDTVAALENVQNTVKHYSKEIGDQELEIGRLEDVLAKERQLNSNLQLEISNLKKQIANSKPSSNDESEIILSLKEKILQIDEEKKKLESTVYQRDKTIELLELELRGPVPVERMNAEKIKLLESRNVELRNSVLTAQTELNELKSVLEAERASKSGNFASQDINDALKDLQTLMITNLSILGRKSSESAVDDALDISNDIWSSSSPVNDRIKTLSVLFENFNCNLEMIINNCSDIAQATDSACVLSSPEGSLDRIYECFNVLSARANDLLTTSEQAQITSRDSENKFSKLLNRIQEIFYDITSSEFDTSAFEFQEDLLDAFKEQIMEHISKKISAPAEEVEKLKTEMEGVCDAYEELMIDNEEQKLNVTELEDKISQQKETIKDLQSILEDRDNEISSRQQQIFKMEIDCQSAYESETAMKSLLNEIIESLNSRANVLGISSIESSSAATIALAGMFDVYDKELFSVREELQVLKTRLEDSDKYENSNKSKIDELLNTISDMKSEEERNALLVTELNGKLSTLSSDNNDLQSQLESLQMSLDSQRSEANELFSENSELRSREIDYLTEIEGLKAKITELMLSIQCVRDEMVTLETEKNNLASQLSESENSQDSELQQLRSSLEVAYSERKSLETSMSEMKISLDHEIGSLRVSIQLAESDRDEWKQKAIDLEATAAEDLKQMSQAKAEFESKAIELESKLCEEVLSSQLRVEELNIQLQSIESEKSNIESELDNFKSMKAKEIEELEQKCQRLQTERDEWEAQETETKSELSSEILDLKFEIKALQSRLDSISSSNNNNDAKLNAQIANLETEKDSLKNRLDLVELENSNMQEELRKANESFLSLKAEFDEKEREYSDFIDQLESEKSKTETQYSKSTEDLLKYKDLYRELEQKFLDQEASKENLVNTLNLQISESSAKISSLESELKSWSDRCNSVESEKLSVVAALNEKISELSKELKAQAKTQADISSPVVSRNIPSNSDLRTPPKNLSSAFEQSSAMKTPTDAALTKSDDYSIRTPSGLNSLIDAASPAAKVVSKTNALLVMERKKLAQLQEDHNDLLELLAQQEVELSTFRTRLGRALGLEALQAAESEAKENTIQKYGSYIDFRQGIDTEDI